MDVVLGAVLLLLASPLLAAAATAIRLDSRGPVFHKGVRVGRGGGEFHIYKLRTMQLGAEQVGPAVTARGDPRITRVGRFLRRTKIDELPQLMNVLKGDMSLVGPRPEHPYYVQFYTERQRKVLSVRPGMTSPASVSYGDEEALLEGPDAQTMYVNQILPAKLELDLRYVDQHGLGEDVRVLLRTVVTVAARLLPGGAMSTERTT